MAKRHRAERALPPRRFFRRSADDLLDARQHINNVRVSLAVDKQCPIDVTTRREFVPCKRSRYYDTAVVGIQSGKILPQLGPRSDRKLASIGDVLPPGVELCLKRLNGRGCR